MVEAITAKLREPKHLPTQATENKLKSGERRIRAGTHRFSNGCR